MRPDLPYAIGGVTLAAALLGNAALASDAAPLRPVDLALVALTGVGVGVCRRYPMTALLLVSSAMLAIHVRVHAGVSAAFAVLAVVYVAAIQGYRWAAALVSVVFLSGFLVYDVAVASADSMSLELTERTSLLMGWFVAANVAGLVVRQHNAYLEQVERRAEEAERTREATALRRAAQERLRIARDLHDSLTHSISVIKVQAGIAVHLARKHGQEPSAALLAIQESSAAAMQELRSTLDVLRSPSDPDSVGLARLGELAERTQAAGVPVQMTVTGQPRDLPAEVDQAGYRVVQEALTNVARHAGPATVEVRVEYAPEQLTVRVADDGLASSALPVVPGVGLRGMRERVTGLGGTLLAEPGAGGGFTVLATFPLDGPA